MILLNCRVAVSQRANSGIFVHLSFAVRACSEFGVSSYSTLLLYLYLRQIRMTC